ncbi:tyrosine-type recombinase/integrase [Campylobacterota bacterium DY0563]
MKFYSRNDILYVRINGKRVSTKLKDTKENIKLVTSYYKNDEFFKKFDVNKNVPTIVELCEEVLDEKEETLKQTTYRAYESIFRNRIKNYFNDTLVNEIKPIDIEKWYKTFSDRSTLINALSVFKPAIEKAILREYIKTTPLVISKPKFTKSYSLNPFTFDEIMYLLDTCKINWFKNLIGINFFTGLRTGEVLGLKWSEIDFTNYTIEVNRTITKGFIQSPKTKSSQRVIDMLPQCEKFLKSQQRLTGLGEYVFISPCTDKHFLDSNSLASNWKRLLKKCNLKTRGIYQLRHSFASNMLSNGEDLLWVSSMLGHKSANITLEKYTKYLRRRTERKVSVLDTINTKVAQ